MKKYDEFLGTLCEYFFGLAFFVVLFAWLFGFNFGHTNEGSVNTDFSKCIVHVELKKGDWQTYWHKFYCAEGSCDAVEMSTFGNQCEANYTYYDSSTAPTPVPASTNDTNWGW